MVATAVPRRRFERHHGGHGFATPIYYLPEQMASRKTTVIVLAAGLGTRMKSARPKVMHAIAGRPMIGHVIAALARLKPARLVLVVGPGMEEVVDAARAAGPRLAIVPVVQRERRGTGHAARLAVKVLKGIGGDVLIVNGDGPLVQPATLAAPLAALRGAPNPAIVVIGMRLPDPSLYGRMVTDENGALLRIVEARDASERERMINLCNSGVIAADARVLTDLLPKLEADNAKREYYLTDIVALARNAGHSCGYVEGPAEELIGIDSRDRLAVAEATMQTRLRGAAMAAGATLVDPTTAWFSYDTRLGHDVTIGPQVVIGPGCEIGAGAEIHAFCHLEGTKIATGARVGPFARLRPGTVIGAGAHVGNFVEIKNAKIAAGAKINHLAYVGDARVGEKANIGAGAITCNYDGFAKMFTDIGAGAFIGSNAALVAPVKVGARAIVAAGAVITRNVPADALALERSPQEIRRGWAKAFRANRARAVAKPRAKTKTKSTPR
jgi:bifunctional UDP-N-acetylglucosamine pyrophosphorylase/glucosamine-1-phosphate N-acetyltransferase